METEVMAETDNPSGSWMDDGDNCDDDDAMLFTGTCAEEDDRETLFAEGFWLEFEVETRILAFGGTGREGLWGGDGCWNDVFLGGGGLYSSLYSVTIWKGKYFFPIEVDFLDPLLDSIEGFWMGVFVFFVLSISAIEEE